jgi:hypothetical protein
MLGPSSGPVVGKVSAFETDKSLVRLTTISSAVSTNHIDVERYFAVLRLLDALLRAIDILPREIKYRIKPDIMGAAALTQG